MAGLVAEDEVPFIAVAGAFLVQSNALSTMGKLLIALETGLNLTPKSRIRDKEAGGKKTRTRRLTARQLAQFLEALARNPLSGGMSIGR